jgi:hypothetical protein
MSDIEHPEYKIGMKVCFADASATVSDNEPHVVEGMVNGEPYADDDGTVTHVPVWAARDNGREATTIIVAIDNMLGEAK